MKKSIRFQLNGKSTTLEADEDRTLLWVLRTDLALTGAKYGCGAGFCGACTVVVDGEAIRSCVTPLAEVEGKKVMTIEGLSRDGELHPLQRAFVEHGGFQCGYCTPGMILHAYAFLKAHPHPTREAILAEMEDSLCRCGAHQRIVTAIEDAARREGGEA